MSGGETPAFLAAVSAVERGWAMVETDPAAVLHLPSAQLLARAAAVLEARGDPAAARRAIAHGLAQTGPTAPILLAHARQRAADSDWDGAADAYRRALLRARPDAALFFELALAEQRAGRPADADAIVAAQRTLACDQPALAFAAGQALRDAGRPDLALMAFARAYRRGHRDHRFLDDLGRLLAATGGEGPAPADMLAMEIAHARLALAQDRDRAVADAAAREASPRWIATGQLAEALARAIAARRPFSWLRLGDGEGRFLLLARPERRGPLDENAARAAARVIWSIWFGQALDETPAPLVAELAGRLDAAIAEADLIGLASRDRLAGDDNHVGYLAAFEAHVAALAPPGRFCDATANYALEAADPAFARLLANEREIGLVSPYPDLAARLRARLGLDRVIAHVIPGERRPDRPGDTRPREPHLPDAFHRTLAALAVPLPGTVFLIAGGLLGKLYAARIRDLGGIALDIGAVADGWMGHNTRGGLLDAAAARPLSPA